MDVFAQIGGAGAAPGNPMISTLLMLLQFLPIFLIIWLLIIRPQQKRQKDLERMLKTLKKGDRVLTSGGIYGTVVGVVFSKSIRNDDIGYALMSASVRPRVDEARARQASVGTGACAA